MNPHVHRIHSWLAPSCEIRESVCGRGVFTSQSLPAGSLVAVWGGIVRTAAEIDLLSEQDDRMASDAICVADGFFLTWHPSGADSAEMFNHSCDANVGIKGQIVVVARRDIAADEELTFDYDTTETTPQPWKCLCGSSKCRGSITGRGWSDSAFLCAHRGYLAWHVEERARRAGIIPAEVGPASIGRESSP